MELEVKNYVEPNVQRVLNTLGFTNCRVFNLTLIKNIERFLGAVMENNRSYCVVLSNNYSYKEEFVRILKALTRGNDISLTIIMSEALKEDTFIICTK